MAFNEKEQAIIDAGKASGKSIDEVKAAIARFRIETPATPVAEPEKKSFGANLLEDFEGIGQNILSATSKAGQNIYDIAGRDDRSVAEKATMIGGEAIKGIGQVVGGTYFQGAKMLLPESVETKVAETAQQFGADVVKYTQDYYNAMKTGDEADVRVAAGIDSLISKYKTDEQFRDQVNAAGGFLAGAAELVGARSTEIGLDKFKYLTRLPEKLKTSDVVEGENFIKSGIDNMKQSQLQSTLRETPSRSITERVTEGALDTAVMGAQRIAQSYRDLVEGATQRTIKVLDRQAINDIAGKPVEYADQRIGEMYINAVSPGVKGKRKTVEGITANNEAAVAAIRDMVTNRQDLKFRDTEMNDFIEGELPTNLWEFGGAITDQKSKVYQRVLQSIGQAADQPVNTDRIVSAMTEIIDDPVYAGETAIVNRARTQLQKYLTNDYTPLELEELIKLENDKLQAYYRGSGTQADAVVSAIVANNLRDMLDEAVETATGEGVSGLKKQYGNLKSIENDVIHRALHNAQAREAGLVDMFGIRTIGDVSGALAGDIGALRRGAGQIAGEGFINALNDRDAMINRMFMVADDAYNRPQSFNQPATAQTTTEATAPVNKKLEAYLSGKPSAEGGYIKNPLANSGKQGGEVSQSVSSANTTAKLTDDEVEGVYSALRDFDSKPLTVVENGRSRIEMGNVDDMIRLDQLKAAQETRALTKKELAEAKDLLSRNGAIAKTTDTPTALLEEAKKYKSAATNPQFKKLFDTVQPKEVSSDAFAGFVHRGRLVDGSIKESTRSNYGKGVYFGKSNDFTAFGDVVAEIPRGKRLLVINDANVPNSPNVYKQLEAAAKSEGFDGISYLNTPEGDQVVMFGEITP